MLLVLALRKESRRCSHCSPFVHGHGLVRSFDCRPRVVLEWILYQDLEATHASPPILLLPTTLYWFYQQQSVQPEQQWRLCSFLVSPVSVGVGQRRRHSILHVGLVWYLSKASRYTYDKQFSC
jgi:hypothetical protein